MNSTARISVGRIQKNDEPQMLLEVEDGRPPVVLSREEAATLAMQIVSCLRHPRLDSIFS